MNKLNIPSSWVSLEQMQSHTTLQLSIAAQKFQFQTSSYLFPFFHKLSTLNRICLIYFNKFWLKTSFDKCKLSHVLVPVFPPTQKPNNCRKLNSPFDKFFSRKIWLQRLINIVISDRKIVLYKRSGNMFLFFCKVKGSHDRVIHRPIHLFSSLVTSFHACPRSTWRT